MLFQVSTRQDFVLLNNAHPLSFSFRCSIVQNLLNPLFKVQVQVLLHTICFTHAQHWILKMFTRKMLRTRNDKKLLYNIFPQKQRYKEKTMKLYLLYIDVIHSITNCGLFDFFFQTSYFATPVFTSMPILSMQHYCQHMYLCIKYWPSILASFLRIKTCKNF